MKLFWRITKYLALVLIPILSFWAITDLAYIIGEQTPMNTLEGIFFVLLAACLILLFGDSVRRLQALWAKFLTGGLFALIYTLLVFFANNFWRYVAFNTMFNWQDPYPFWEMVNADLVYTEGLGALRYPLCFLAFFAVASALLLIAHPALRTKVAEKQEERELKKIMATDPEELVQDYIEYGDWRFNDYLTHLEPTEENKNMLLALMFKYPDLCFIGPVLFRFADLFTDEEYAICFAKLTALTEEHIREQEEALQNHKAELNELIDGIEKRRKERHN